MSDNINHPSHYTQGGIECIDAIKASMTHQEFIGYLKGNCIKYLWRYRNKGRAIEDLKKAQWYLEQLISENERVPTINRLISENEGINVLNQDGAVTTHEIYYPNK